MGGASEEVVIYEGGRIRRARDLVNAMRGYGCVIYPSRILGLGMGFDVQCPNPYLAMLFHRALSEHANEIVILLGATFRN
jgi:hypothetical protein